MQGSSDALRFLLELIGKFVSGEDRSLILVNQIESVLAVNFTEASDFPDEQVYEDLVVALSSYWPGGGDFLYDEEGILRAFKEVLNTLGSPDRVN